MAKLKTRKELTDKIKKVEKDGVVYTPINTDIMVSTGSTLLDLCISGGRVRGGGMPGGIMIEIFGPSSSGKTALLVELGASVQGKGGDVKIGDPEARLDKQYSKIYGLELPKDNYTRPNTVVEMFTDIDEWEPENKKAINMYGGDSIAALSTEKEMQDEDKRGQLKAKQLSSWCRKISRKIAHNNKLLVLTNQVRQGEYGLTTPGGFAIDFHSSLRININRKKRVEVEKKLKSGRKVTKSIGIYSEALIRKSSIDDEYRTAPIYIISGIGIDDIRANLQFIKDMNKYTMYLAVDKEYQQLAAAIRYIEDYNLESDLREMVIDLWEEIERKFKVNRKKKVRF